MLKHKTLTLSGVKTAGLDAGQFEGFASVFDHLDAQGDVVRRGAFAKSLDSGRVTPLIWEHQSKDPRAFVGEVKAAEETDEGLRIVGQFDMDTDAGAAAYRQVKARRVGALSIGYSVRDQRKSADGANELLDLDLAEISIVSRPANDRALIGAVKSNEASDKSEESARLVKARQDAAELVAEDKADEPEDKDMDLTLGERLVASLEAALADAKELIDAAEAEGRDLTEDEAGAVEKAHRRARLTKADVEQWADMSPAERHGLQYARDRYAKGFDPEAFEAAFGTADAPSSRLVKFDAPAFIKSRNTTRTKAKEAPTMTATKYLGLGIGRKSFGQTIADSITGAGHHAPGEVPRTKALTSSGQVVTDVPLQAGVIPQGRPALSITDVLPVTKRGGPQWRYIRQASRALNAAPVAPGATKPTSTLGVSTIDGEATVIAHLSEPADKFVLGDNVALGRFVADELVYGLDKALEAQVIGGDGTGANLTGILETSGVQVQTFATNALTSIRKAITAQETLGYEPSVLFISPADWEAIELKATSDEALAFRGVPIDLMERKVWGLRAVLTTALPAETAVVLDPSAVSVDVVGSAVDIEWDASGALFETNQMRVRVEGRFGLSVYRPEAIVRVETAAA